MLSIGSNLGDRLAHLRSVVAALRPVAVSPVYETAPWGGVGQDDYLNAIVVVDDAGTDAYGWLAKAHELEQAAGAHERAFVLVPWADVAPDAVLPGYGRVADLATDLAEDGSDVRRTDLELR